MGIEDIKCGRCEHFIRYYDQLTGLPLLVGGCKEVAETEYYQSIENANAGILHDGIQGDQVFVHDMFGCIKFTDAS
jgi:hypothetical protein